MENTQHHKKPPYTTIATCLPNINQKALNPQTPPELSPFLSPKIASPSNGTHPLVARIRNLHATGCVRRLGRLAALWAHKVRSSAEMAESSHCSFNLSVDLHPWSTDTAIQSFSFAPFSLSLARPEGNLCGPHTLTDLPSKRASKLICHYTTAGLDHHGGRRRSLSPLQLAVNVSLVRQLKSLFTLKLSSGVKNCFARGFLLVS